MSNHYLPPCCTELSHQWLLPTLVPDMQMVSCRFEPSLWHPEQFERAQIPAARGLAKRQSEFLAGRICAREAIQKLNGDYAVPQVGEDGAPIWPESLCGSISHGHQQAMAVVASREQWRSVGLDLEKRLSVERAQRLAAEILTPAEQGRIAELSPEQQALRITLTFSLKESLFKALYPLAQKRFYFHDAELIEPISDSSARLRLLIDLHPDWPTGSVLEGQFCLHAELLVSLIAVPH